MESLKKQRADYVTYSILNKNLLQLNWKFQSVNMTQRKEYALDPHFFQVQCGSHRTIAEAKQCQICLYRALT